MTRASKWFYGIALCLFVVAFLVRCTQNNECESKGGERMRPALGAWKCYDKESLKELK